jgi:CubicO group peptidase (beta-lactamase class C family)
MKSVTCTTALATCLVLMTGATGRGIAIRGFAGQPVSAEHIDREATRMMAEAKVQGLAMAVIDDGSVVFVRSWGRRNVDKDLPLQTDTIMYGASLTKFAFAYMVMQLVDEGKLGLDRSIADYLPKPLPEYSFYAALRDDERWRKLTPRILLSHTSGLANFAFLEPDQKMRLHFDPGTRYAYSGEGFILLQFVLETGLGLKVGDEMQRRVFDRFGMTRTSMMWRADFAENLADGYGIDGAFEAHDQRSKPRGRIDGHNHRRLREVPRRSLARRGPVCDLARGDGEGPDFNHHTQPVPNARNRHFACDGRHQTVGRSGRCHLRRSVRSCVLQGRP